MRCLTVTGVQTCALPILVLGDASPVLGHLGPVGQSIPQQDDQCSSRQGHPCVRALGPPRKAPRGRSEEHTSELQSQSNLVCRLLLEKKKKKKNKINNIHT